ncbi:Uncharacterised protein [Vibrio cholerae]|uniref:Uncharacterized protein n=1 Tax=Vibrio cholerae TaxID=666 RepID=A0A655Q5W2_VIBCL|nr:Uncharacterised protein [Vibrio cholerae]CSA92349.1 Uncharacterised protein [Vibrio cholerae]CSB96482.1 Uncharacterised protein [Vibrio cholerae]CSD17678.1 Uncharacterised protein [Vibrio cholerae]CSI41910.1 Uncharacterised protein [Vibrio cholerae]
MRMFCLCVTEGDATITQPNGHIRFFKVHNSDRHIHSNIVAWHAKWRGKQLENIGSHTF